MEIILYQKSSLKGRLLLASALFFVFWQVLTTGIGWLSIDENAIAESGDELKSGKKMIGFAPTPKKRSHS